MIQNPKIILLEILNSIDYSGNKEIFADKFLKNCQLEALNNLIVKLPQEKQDIIKQQLQNSNKTVVELVKEYFTDQEYLEKLKIVSAGILKEYLETIQPTLSFSQKDKLQLFLSSLAV